MFVANQDAFTCPPHPILLIMLFQSFEACQDRGVLFWLGLFGAECVIAERI